MKIAKLLYSKYDDLEIHFASRRKLRVRSNNMSTINGLVESELRMSYSIIIPPELVESKAIVEIPADEELTEKYIYENLEIKYYQGYAINPKLLEVKRFSKPDGQNGRIDIDLVQLTFSGLILPAKICLDRIIFPVKPFIERVSQCSKCWRFGHLTKSCRRSKSICCKCGCSHDGICKKSTICVNCSKSHDAKYQYCETRIRLNKEAKEKAYRRLPMNCDMNGPSPLVTNIFSLNLEDFPALTTKRKIPQTDKNEGIKRGRNVESTANIIVDQTSTDEPMLETSSIICTTTGQIPNNALNEKVDSNIMMVENNSVLQNNSPQSDQILTTNTSPEDGFITEMKDNHNNKGSSSKTESIDYRTTISTNLNQFESFAKSIILGNPDNIITHNENH